MNSRVIAAIVAAVLAVLGIGLAVFYASSANARAYEGAKMGKVYVVSTDVPANTESSALAKSVELVELPVAAVAKGAVTDLAEVEGLKTTVPLVQGEQLLTSRFDKAGSEGATGSAGVPDGLQEITLALEPANAGIAVIDTGARVGVVATVTPKDKEPQSRMIAQNIVVTSTNRDEKLVTIAVDGKMATRIAAVVAQGGSIHLTAQNSTTTRDAGGAVDTSSVLQ